MARTDAIRVLCIGEYDGVDISDIVGGQVSAVEVRSQAGAIRRLQKEVIDCIVICPVDTPELKNLITRLKRQSPSIPIIVVKDPADPTEVIDALNAGATKYLRPTEVVPDLEDLIRHLTDTHFIDSSIDRHRELNRAIWAATYTAVSAEDRRHIETVIYDQLAAAGPIESVYIAHEAADHGYLTVREPFFSTLYRSQVELLFGESGGSAIEAAFESGEVQTVEGSEVSASTGDRVNVAVPISVEGEPDGLVLLTVSPPPAVDSADELSLRRFGGVIGQLFEVSTDVRETATRTDAVMELVSHEVRNPLTTAMSSLQIARETGDEPAFDRVRRALEEIDRTISTLNTLYSRNGSSQATEKPFEVTARRAWEDTATPVATLELDEIGAIRAHHDLLERLLVNLFRNAIQYSAGDVTVSVGPLPDGFFVEDNGPGIATENRDSIFEWGFTTSDSGFGVGLALVKDIATFHGWSIELAGSTDGARFEIRGADIEAEVDSDDGSTEPVTDP